MTFSILARDDRTGHMGGAAATGSLCVGGWVLRGDPRAGMSASQGAAPSTLWGEDVLDRMRGGAAAPDAVAGAVAPDPNRAARQLAALDPSGQAGVHTGADNTDVKGSRSGGGVVVSGNLLVSDTVLDAILDGFVQAQGPLADRLLAALRAGEAEGGDSRGLQSAALLVVGRDIPPLSLRIDDSEAPIADLGRLLARATGGDYAAWTRTVPVPDDPFRR